MLPARIEGRRPAAVLRVRAHPEARRERQVRLRARRREQEQKLRPELPAVRQQPGPVDAHARQPDGLRERVPHHGKITDALSLFEVG